MFHRLAGPAALLISTLAVLPHGKAQDSPATVRLIERNQSQFRKDIVHVTNGVYTAVGYDVSTVSMIEGDTGLIIVDTGQAVPRSKATLSEFRKISDKPIAAIILTHGHGDHTGGAAAFVEGGNPEIWARDNFGAERSSGIVRGSRPVGAAGMELPPELRINNGVAPAMYRPGTRPGGGAARSRGPRGAGAGGLRAGTGAGRREQQRGDPPGMFLSRIQPSKRFSEERRSLEIAGVKLELVAAPGETLDQLYVWLPDRKVLFAGDNFYRAFPNIYPLRGVRRSATDWNNSLQKMIAEKPEFLVGGHTRPVIGRDSVKQILGDYQEAVQFVYDKTIEGMAQGMTPDELVEYVKLPTHLADKDYLADYYGAVSFSVRAIYSQSVGWFDGNPTSIAPLPPQAEAKRMAKLAGGKDKLLAQTRTALADGDAQWAAQLSDYLLALDPSQEIRNLKAEALTALANNTINAPSRNYYHAYAQYLRSDE